MILIFSTKENLPKVPAEVQAYLNALNAQGFLFDKLYVPGGDKDVEIEVCNTVTSDGVVNTAVCLDAQIAGMICDWARQFNAG